MKLYVTFAWGFCCVALAVCLDGLAELHTRSGANLRRLAGELMEYGLGMGVWD